MAVRFYDKQLLEHEFAKSLSRALGQGFTFAYSLSTDVSKDAETSITKLTEMMAKYKNREYGKAVFAADFEKLVKHLAVACPEA